MHAGTKEGEECGRCGCNGVIELSTDGLRPVCPVCGWDEKNTTPDDLVCDNCGNEDQGDFIEDEETGEIVCGNCGWPDEVMRREELEAAERLLEQMFKSASQ